LHSSRRSFLQQFAAFSCSCSAGATTAVLQAQDSSPAVAFPVKPRDRLAVTSWPFRAYIESPTNRGRDPRVPGMDLEQFPAMVIEKFGVYNVNPLLDHLRSTGAAYLESFRKAVENAGSHLVDFGLPGRRFGSPDASVRQAAFDDACRWIEIAKTIGSPSVRQHLGADKNNKPDLEATCSSLARLADYAHKRNVVVNLENDNPIGEDPFFIVQVIQKVANPFLRALPDFGNSLPKYGAAKNEEAIAAMFQHAFNMSHVKDTVQSDSGETYKVDLERMFAIAKQSSYRGYFSMEFDTSAGDPFAGTSKLIQQTLEYLS
jgi:sugar phosphate isomerase/epimerase